MAGSRSTTDTPDTAPAVVDNPTNVPAGDDFELVYVCNPKIHGKLPVEDRPAPGRVSRLWLRTHADAGWVECDANGKEL